MKDSKEIVEEPFLTPCTKEQIVPLAAEIQVYPLNFSEHPFPIAHSDEEILKSLEIQRQMF